MKVLITGATGFVGSHVCRTLMRSGHQVRLLVRNPGRAQELFNPCPELAEGDVTNVEQVRAAITGCDALVHAAAATPLHLDSVEALFAVNVGGTKNLVDAALEEGISRIVCVSSIAAIFNVDGAKVTADSPPTPSSMPYGQSKVETEYYLRDLQSGGAPIAIVYPGGILGPQDPGFSDTLKALKYRIENGFRIFGNGGVQHVDARDMAAFVEALLDNAAVGRYLLPGVYHSWVEMADMIDSVSGCQLQRIPTSGRKMRMIGRLIDIVRKFKPVDSPISAETMRYATQWPNIANTEALQKYGLELRDPSQTFADTIDWMIEAGYLDAAQCPVAGERMVARG